MSSHKAGQFALHCLTFAYTPLKKSVRMYYTNV